MHGKFKLVILVLLIITISFILWKYYSYSRVQLAEIRDNSSLLVTRIISYEDTYFQRVVSLQELLIDTSLVRKNIITNILKNKYHLYTNKEETYYYILYKLNNKFIKNDALDINEYSFINYLLKKDFIIDSIPIAKTICDNFPPGCKTFVFKKNEKFIYPKHSLNVSLNDIFSRYIKKNAESFSNKGVYKQTIYKITVDSKDTISVDIVCKDCNNKDNYIYEKNEDLIRDIRNNIDIKTLQEYDSLYYTIKRCYILSK